MRDLDVKSSSCMHVAYYRTIVRLVKFEKQCATVPMYQICVVLFRSKCSLFLCCRMEQEALTMFSLPVPPSITKTCYIIIPYYPLFVSSDIQNSATLLAKVVSYTIQQKISLEI